MDKSNTRVMSLIGSGHALSHFYLLCLPPLFPLLKAEFDVSYAELGLLITILNLATGATQVPSGILVDRFGARALLITGLLISGVAIALIGLVPAYWVIVALVIIAGIGNSVFHPADYAILSASVTPDWMGRAFALHTFTGNLGFVAAPATMIALASFAGWRVALMVAGSFALIVSILLWRYGDILKDDAKTTKSTETNADNKPAAISNRQLLLSPVILTLFLFFVAIAMVTSGMQTFSVTALVNFQGHSLADANTILTAFLIASAAGVLLGGPIADRSRRHGLVAATAMLSAALVLFIIGNGQWSVLMLIIMFTLVGLLQGCIRPARDMMVKSVTPPGASGRVFGFVSTGLNVGSAITPVLFGYIIDLGHARWVFILLGIFLLLAIATVGIVRRTPGKTRVLAPSG